MTEIDEKALEAAARVEAGYDGNDWVGMSRVARERYMDRLRAAILAYEAAKGDGWLPIESAPKERAGWKTQIIQLWDGSRVRQGYWEDNRYAKKPRPFWAYVGSVGRTDDRSSQPTRWRHLPSPPLPSPPEPSP